MQIFSNEMKKLYRERNIVANQISVVKEEFLSTVNELATINSITTSYTESVISEKSSELSQLTLSSSALGKLKLGTMSQTSSKTASTLTSSSEPKSTLTSTSETTSTLTTGSSIDTELIQYEVEKKPSNENLPNSWKAVSEYDEFWSAWENGSDIEKIKTAMNKIQDVFEQIHLPEPPLALVQNQTKSPVVATPIDGPTPSDQQKSRSQRKPTVAPSRREHINEQEFEYFEDEHVSVEDFDLYDCDIGDMEHEAIEYYDSDYY